MTSNAGRKDVQALLRAVRRQGALVTPAGGHWRVQHPRSGHSVRIGSSPGSAAQVRTYRVWLRRLGFDL